MTASPVNIPDPCLVTLEVPIWRVSSTAQVSRSIVGNISVIQPQMRFCVAQAGLLR
jgi:hypothetical protein